MHLQTDVKETKESPTQLYTPGNSLPGIMTYQVLREHDGTMQFTYLSESVEKLTGKTPEEVIKEPKILYDLIHEDDWHKVAKAEDISYLTMSIFDIVVRSRTSSGEVGWLHICSVPHRIADGRVVWDGVYIDITEIMEKEKLLNDKEMQLRLFVDNNPAAIAMLDKEMKYIIASKRWTVDYNLDHRDIIGKSHYEISPEISQQWKDVHQRCLAGSIEKNEDDLFIRADGSKDWVRWETQPWYTISGEVGGIILLTEVITERKKAELELERSEKNLRYVLASMADDFYAIDLNYNVIIINEAAERNLEKFWGKPVKAGTNILDLIPGTDNQQVQENFRKVFTGEKIAYEVHHSISGHSSWAFVSLIPITDDKGKIIGAHVTTRDISESKRAEQKLIENENRLRTILHTEPECIKLLGQDGELLDMNPAGLAMIEADSLEQVKGHCVEMLIEPAYKKKFHQLTLNVFKGGSGKLEFEMIGLKGTRRWLETHAVPLKDAEGKITSLLSVTRDITERKKGEEDLLREKNLSDSIINSMPGIFYLYDEEGKFLRWNKNFETVTGYNAAELSKLHPLDFFAGDEKKLAKEKIIETFENGMAELEAFAVVKSKEKIPFYFTCWRVIFEGKTCLIGVGIDVTKRKNAEMEMFVANERFSLIARATNDFVWDSYLDVDKLWWNDNYYSQLGWQKGTEIPGRDSWEDHIHKTDKKRVVERLTHILDHTKDSTWTDEYRFGKADNTYINVYDRGYIMRDDKGKAYRMIGAMTDISEMKKTVELLKNSYEDIRRLASHLEKIREEERITIAREIHDELGQQLTVLKMDISWINKNLTPKEEKVKQKMADLFQMIDLTIKTVRRISSELRPSVLDDLGLIAALEWLSGDFEKRSGIKTKFVADTNDLNLDANTSTALFRIFQESLTNIARHAQASEVYASLKKENDKLLISIKDNGKGFVLSSIENKKTLGILGIKERVALLQGEYEIISSPGHGSIVKILVPVSSITEPKTSQ